MKNQVARAGIFGVVFLAPFLGGATQPWSQSLVLALVALVVLLVPPRKVNAPVAGTGLGLIALAALSFLPAGWFTLPAWRSALTGVGIALPPTLSPQPWVSLDCLVVFSGGFLWALWLVQQPWPPDERRFLARLLGLAAFLLAVVALGCFYSRQQIPFWLKTERGFGPFPNRNQTADFFALTALVSLGLAYDSFKHRALVLSYSRAGIAIFFLGLIAWVAALSNSYKKVGIGLGAILGLLTVFLLFGGATLERFLSGNTADFRLMIWKDAWAMIQRAPWHGVGLGNFEALFPFFRDASILQQRIKHPESDWLWIAAEIGLPALLLVFAGIGTVLKRSFPFRRNSARILRAACAGASLAFIAHGCMDVSAHRLGTVLPALLILALSLNPPRDSSQSSATEPSRWVPWLFRLAAIALLCAAWARLQDQPGGLEKTRQVIAQKNFPRAVSHATSAMRLSPLDWELYYLRGSAQAATGQWMGALFDFRKANLLEPHLVQLPMMEGNLWLSVNPAFALGSWQEVLRRCAPADRSVWFAKLLDRSSRFPGLIRAMESMTGADLDLELDFLPYLPPEQQEGRIARLLEQADGFAPGQRNRLFLMAARHRADHQEFEPAYHLARKGVFAPILPKEVESPNALRDFSVDPGNFSAGFALYSAQLKAGAFSEALQTLDRVNGEPNAPKYFRFLAAELNAQLGHWEKAWGELKIYAGI